MSYPSSYNVLTNINGVIPYLECDKLVCARKESLNCICANLWIDKPPLLTTGNILYYDNVDKKVSYGPLSITSTDAGFSYVNTTTSLLSIPTTLTKIPISYAVSPTVSYSFNWSNQWSIPVATDNRFVFSGSGIKKFVMRCDVNLTTGGSASTVHIALYKNGSCLTNGITSQTVGIFGAINPTIELLHWQMPFTATTNDYFELFVYGLSTGISIGATTPSPMNFSPSTVAPAISIECEQINI